MGRLADAYLAARGGGDNDGGGQESTSLDAALAALWARGRAAHPGFAVDDAVFAAHLARCGTSIDDPGACAEDLYLACAGLMGDPAAIRTLRRVHRPVLAGYLRHIDGAPAFVDEIEQRLWDAVLVGTAQAAPRLASYSGQGPLAGWIGVAAQRIALMMRRHEAAEGRALEALAAEVRVVADDPELAFIKGTLREKFQRAISQALGALDDRARMIYRLHLVDDLTVEGIGKMYGVSHSTVSRWLAQAREAVIAEARRVLRDEMQLSAEEFDSVAGLVVSRLDLSVGRILRSAS